MDTSSRLDWSPCEAAFLLVGCREHAAGTGAMTRSSGVRITSIDSRGDGGPDQRCNNEEPELLDGPSPDKYRWPDAAGRIDRGVIDRNANQVDQGENQADGKTGKADGKF